MQATYLQLRERHTSVLAFFPNLFNQVPKSPADWTILDISAWLFYYLLFTIILLLLFTIYYHYFPADLSFFSCVFAILTFASHLFAIFYKTVTQTFNVVSLNFSKIIKKSMGWSLKNWLAVFFKCPINYINWIPFESSSNYFSFFKSTAINL